MFKMPNKPINECSSEELESLRNRIKVFYYFAKCYGRSIGNREAKLLNEIEKELLKRIKGEIKMKKECVQVKFEGSDKVYSFLNDIEGIEVKDIVVADTKNGLVLCKVVGVTSSIPAIATAWIVNKVDLVGLQAKKNREKDIKSLKERLWSREVELKEQMKMQELAKKDPVYGNLLDRLNQLTSEETTPTEPVPTPVFPYNIGNFIFVLAHNPSNVLNCIYNPKNSFHEVKDEQGTILSQCNFGHISDNITKGIWKVMS